MEQNKIERVSIALKPNVYNTFRNLVNTVSNTLGEYVDNAVQSFLDNKDQIAEVEPGYKLIVEIRVDWTERNITITDNAAGIGYKNYERAFEPAHIPQDNTGLNQFGMGMKTASVWLADNWCVYTKAFGEEVERFTEFDLKRVTSEGREDLLVKETPKNRTDHYTKIVLYNLSKNAPSTNQMDKIRRHLSSIYRKFLRTNEIEIIVNDERLEAPNYEILKAPYYKDPNGEEIEWKKDIDFQMGEYKAKGFIAILSKIQNNANGLVLMQRGRVIVGGGEERYFPSVIFGQSGSFRYRRLFGELELEGFEVTFNKNGFRDEEDLYAFMEALRDELKSSEFNLLGQTDNYRQRAKEEQTAISHKIKKNLAKEDSPKKLTRQVQNVANNIQNTQYIEKTESTIKNAKAIDSHTESFVFNDKNYILRIDMVTESATDALYSVIREESPSLFDTADTISIVCKINLAHPFFTRYEQFKKGNDYMPIISIFKALTLAEIMAPERGTKYASNIRLLFNQYIIQQ